MKKFLYFTSFILISLFTTIIIYLSTTGLETSKFNNLIIKEIHKKEPKIELELRKITIKLDLKKIQLFFSTSNPMVTYQDINIPIRDIKIYVKINKILSSKIEATKVAFTIEKFKIDEIQKIAIRIKPSNFKTYLLNNLEGGEIEKVFLDLSVDKNFKLTDYKVNGTIKKVNTQITKDFELKKVSFNFKTDNNITLINSINASYEGISITNGSINLQRNKIIEINGKFNTQFKLNTKNIKKLFKKIKFLKTNEILTQGALLHEFNIKISNNLKIASYEYKSRGNILRAEIDLKKVLKSKFIKKPLKKILFKETRLEINFNKNNKNFIILDGLYSTGESNYKKFKIRNNLNKKNLTYSIDFDLSEIFFFDVINFETNPKKKSNIKSIFSIKNNKLNFKSINFTEGKNLITIKELVLNDKSEVVKIGSIDLITFDKDKENNNFKINFEQKLSITGKKYDSTHLFKLISEDSKSNLLKNFTNEVVINFKNIITKSQIPINNFNLIGLIVKGEFNKISAKSEFSKNKYLDFTLNKDPNKNRILEIYSDYPQALLANYKFFEGIKGGKLLYNSVIDKTGSASKLTIENFKIINAPAFATLLTLADLRGYADLLTGKGMSFNILEIQLEDDTNVTNVKEIIALGSSISLHMEGYIEKKTGLVSLSGTMVPAKTLNRLVSNIPVIGNILVGKELGEGVFGVSFKMKGLPGKIKTTINPVKTITPRFITRAIEKMKKN